MPTWMLDDYGVVVELQEKMRQRVIEPVHNDDDDDAELFKAGSALQKILCELGLSFKPPDIMGINFKTRTVRARCAEQACQSPRLANVTAVYHVPAEKMAALGEAFARFLAERGLAEDAAAVTRALVKYVAEGKTADAPTAGQKEKVYMSEKKDEQAEAPESVGKRLRRALSEGVRRAPVEIALEEGQAAIMKMLLAGFKGTRHEKDVAKKFLMWFFSTPAGQATIAAAIAGAAPPRAGLLGKGGPAVQRVADEFGARGATILVREGAKTALSVARPAMGVFTRLFEAEKRRSIGPGVADTLFEVFKSAPEKKNA